MSYVITFYGKFPESDQAFIINSLIDLEAISTNTEVHFETLPSSNTNPVSFLDENLEKKRGRGIQIQYEICNSEVARELSEFFPDCVVFCDDYAFYRKKRTQLVSH